MHFDKTLIHTNNLNLYKLSQKIEINTCNMRLLFPIQEKYNQIVMKMEFHNLQNPETTSCIELIQKIEQYYYEKLCNHLKNHNYKLKSQIEQFKNYNPYLLCKIIRKKNKQKEVITKVHKPNSTIYDIKARDIFYMSIYIDNLFMNQNKKEIIVKWKVSNIYNSDISKN